MNIDRRKIETLMAEKGLTVKALCDIGSISRKGYYNIMHRGSCRTDTVRKFADGLGVSVSEIIEN